MNDFNYRPKRCDDCGFTKGTKANGNGVTEIKANLCAEISEPFYCHFNAEEEALPGGINFQLKEGKEFVCQGWVETCNELAAKGHYESQPEWKRGLKKVLLEAICDIEEKLQKREMSQEQAVEYINWKIMESL